MEIKLDVTKKMTHEVFGVTEEESQQIIDLVSKEYVDKIGKLTGSRTAVLQTILEQIPEKNALYACFFFGYTVGAFENGYEKFAKKE
jgi:hypothetical protein